MSDDLSKKIKQITDILGQDSLPDNLKGILSLLGTSSGSQQGQQSPTIASAQSEEPVQKSELNESLEMVNRVKTLMDRVRADNDPRVNLLSAVKPFLNNTRQKRLGSCIRILQMSSLVRYMDEHEK
jgi:hypothetical protein